MSGSLFTEAANHLGPVWREYWGTAWHTVPPWGTERLACFMTASQARNDVNRNGEPLVSDFPKGRRPFLGVLTNSGQAEPSIDSGVLEYNDDGHLLTIAPTRAGKGTGQIIPNLLLYAGSCVVMDIKGENYDLTHGHRQRFFEGAQVLKFGPFEDDSVRYNPLDFVRVNPDGSSTSMTFDDARLLSEMLIPARADESFWDTEARGLLTTIIFYVATKYRPGGYDRTMQTVVELLFPSLTADDSSPIDGTITKMRRAADLNGDVILNSLLSQFTEHEPKVRAGILSTCRSAMTIWLSTRLQDITSWSDFRFSDLKRSMCRPASENPAPTTLYVVIPPEYLTGYRTVLRMMVGLAAVELTRPHEWATPENLEAGWWSKPPCPVLFLLDEFPALGYMPPIEQGVAYLAGYGVQIWTFAQSIGQLRNIYKDNWTTFVANAGASCYFSITDLELCQFLSQQLGDTKEYALKYTTTSESEGTSWSSSYSSNSGSSFGGESQSYSRGDSDSSGEGGSTSTTVSEQIRFKKDPVATPSEIRALPNDTQLVLMRNRRPILSRLMHHHRFRLFDERTGTWRD